MGTIRIKSTHPESQGAFVIIDSDAFDSSVHEEYAEPSSVANLPADIKGAVPDGSDSALCLPSGKKSTKK